MSYMYTPVFPRRMDHISHVVISGRWYISLLQRKHIYYFFLVFQDMFEDRYQSDNQSEAVSRRKDNTMTII